MARADMQDKPNDNPISTFFVISVLLAMLLAVAWYFWSPYIAWGTVQSTLFLKNLLVPFTIFMSDDYADFILNMEERLAANLNYATVTVSEVMFLQSIAFRAISVVIVPLLLWRGLANIIFAKKYGFTRQLDLMELAEIQATRYPRMKPVIKARLLEQDQRFGPWATSRNPLPYLVINGLVSDIDDAERLSAGVSQFRDLNVVDQHDRIHDYHGRLIINRSGVSKLLRSQLGALCNYTDNQLIDINKLPTIERTMAILFLAARTKKKEVRKRINALLDQFGDSFVEGQPARNGQPAIAHQIDLSGVDELWDDVKEDYRIKLAILEISKTHAYWTTAFTAMFQFIYNEFRNLKSRDFIFLKPVNRTLYLLCNQVGLEASRAETNLIRAHYLAEKKLGSPIIEPFVAGVEYELLHHIQSEGWLAKDIVEDDQEKQLEALNDQCMKDLREFKDRASNKETAEETA